MVHYGHTIAAVSTPPGKGGVALIRVSGDQAFEIASHCFVPLSKKPLAECKPRYAIYGHIYAEGQVVDDGILTLFPAPHSYTGEDTVEICCHGGILLTQRILSGLFCAGAVPAEAGEFTRRAFINGKLSLSQAEAVGQLLEAKTNAQLTLAGPSARSAFALEMERISGMLLSLLSSLYATIDYPEEDLGELTACEIDTKLGQAVLALEQFRRTYKAGHAISEGIATVICGRPNVGKSSLYNCLCGEEYAIVTDEAGTTRDVLERVVSAGQVTLRLFDTAGLRDAESLAEQKGVQRSRAHIDSAELIIAVFDRSSPLSDEDKELLALLSQKQNVYRIGILNKCDLPPVLSESDISSSLNQVLSLSSAEGDISALVSLIEALYMDETITPG
ncbi:MAG: tRNA uridine-5-carboxymethylaminomethyl(34) synthesis GTPase MnmE, partial [Clostridia bacterium]|nr:tRNA uridine-5-carboxymethylaminomethyl(34) synthesis GTPase MnmE [Clostridia bacterium]